MADVKEFKNTTKEAVPSRSAITSPYFDLESSIAVAQVIYNQGGGTCTGDQLAAWLQYKSTQSGTYLTRISAANKHFKLITQDGDRFTVTERAKKILAPIMPEDAQTAKVEAFLDVVLFSKVFEDYRGNQLPPEAGIKNLFQSKYKILPDRVPQAVRVFLSSAEQAGFFSTTGDRSRLIKPAIIQSNNAPLSAPDDAQPIQAMLMPPEKPRGHMLEVTSSGVHSAITGLLRELPPPGPWDSAKKKRFLDAFKATIDFIYPEPGAE